MKNIGNRVRIPSLMALLVPFLSLRIRAEESPSEIRIDKVAIVPAVLERPSPQGAVDDNPPWIHVVVPLVPDNIATNAGRKAEAARVKWKRCYYFKLSQDREFRSGVIESGPKHWSFWNPFRTLEKGTWFWTYGVADPASPNQPVWCKDVYAFVISGSEHVVAKQPPSADDIIHAVRGRKGPVVSTSETDIGKMIPDKTWPELAKVMRSYTAEILAKDRGMKELDFAMSESDVPPHLKGKVERNFFAVRARGLWVRAERHTSALLRGYLLTGDKEYLERGVKRATELESIRQNKIYTILGSTVKVKDIAIYDSVGSFLVDGFYDYIPENQRQSFIDAVLDTMAPTQGGRQMENGPRLHENLEHVHYDQHDWQFKVMDLVVGSLTLMRQDPRMEEWFRYAYELWLYRSPAMSRDDGGCREGNGYFGVHENSLVHTNWVLYQLTGYNYFTYKPWYSNVSKYLAFTNPAGNPGQAFSDGGDGGADLPYFAEVLACMCPDNPWNLWRMKTVGRPDPAHFNADLYKGNKAWDLLQVWNRFKVPDLSNVKPPAVLAAEFRDLGIMAAHTDMVHPEKNMMVNFMSCPFGSSTHAHPCQNAFNVAYGDETLFWRTGYYNGGSDHNVMSYKASRAHNTILADGFMQGFDISEYGWLPRFATADRISYALGDASRAYDGVHRYVKEEDRRIGVGDAGVTRFRRHVAVLRPGAVVIYDELEDKKPVPWTFMLHSQYRMKDLGGDAVLGANSHAFASARIFGSSPVVTDLTDKFAGVPVDEENKRGGENPPHWHWAVTTRESQQKARFLTVIQLTPGKVEEFKGLTLKSTQRDGRLSVDIRGYRIEAEMDASKDSLLVIHSADDRAALSTGRASEKLELGGGTKTATIKGSTLLWERPESNVEIFEEKKDELPDVLKYGNVY